MQDMTRMNLQGTTRNESAYVREVTEAATGRCILLIASTWRGRFPTTPCTIRCIPPRLIRSIRTPTRSAIWAISKSGRVLAALQVPDCREFRAMMPGRLVSIHCMNLPTSKVRDGYIGIEDFRGEIIRAFEDAGFIYHSEVCIWKDPVTAMQRTKALGLLHKQIKKDSCMSRQGVPDYLVTMRKPGDNPERVSNTNETFPVQLWQQYASPVWMDINPSDTLQYRSAREHDDERHICPLQLEVIRRAIKLWSNPGDTVWSPFTGIGSEGCRSGNGPEVHRQRTEAQLLPSRLAGTSAMLSA